MHLLCSPWKLPLLLRTVPNVVARVSLPRSLFSLGLALLRLVNIKTQTHWPDLTADAQGSRNLGSKAHMFPDSWVALVSPFNLSTSYYYCYVLARKVGPIISHKENLSLPLLLMPP